jgi:hypothetical protein
MFLMKKKTNSSKQYYFYESIGLFAEYSEIKNKFMIILEFCLIIRA